MENKQDILKKLGSNDIELVTEAIEQIKTEGDLSIVPELLDILLQCKEPVIITHITSLLSDIKDSGFKTILMEKLIQAANNSEKPNLLRICWESAIDFSEYMDIFLDILLKDDFISALEASTVIENLSDNLSEVKIKEAIERIKALPADDDKAFLLEGVLLHLEEMLDSSKEDDDEEEHHHCGCDGHD